MRGQYSEDEIKPVTTDLSSLLKAVSRIADNPAEDDEERRKRIEAEENANNLGAVLGTVIGLASEAISSAKSKQDEEIEERQQYYEEESYYKNKYEDYDDDYDENEDVGFGLSM